MPLALPKPIADYFAADRTDGAAIAKYFTPDAVVFDEKKRHVGREAIARWKNEASTKYDYVAEIVDIDGRDGHFIVTAHLTGNFPGSPVDLRYNFILVEEEIARLEIGL
ncbi:nuclear transport factor 2 family protein [Aestuariivirga sp.]|uniref:nuclear transport factor 2 family protein n=1 Tax=Aestuariivirga sp. TaxID=2650926 RepID=UPI003BA85326